MNVLVNRFRHSRKRMILLDFEGTLWKRDLRNEVVLRLGRGVDVDLEEGGQGYVHPLYYIHKKRNTN